MAVILIVEDEVFTRELAGICIQDWGHSVLFAGSVEEALSLLKSPQPIDALFTDIYLKTAAFGGCELARLAIVLRPGLRVLYTTGNSATDQLKSLFVAGSHFLSVSPTRPISSICPSMACSQPDGCLAIHEEPRP